MLPVETAQEHHAMQTPVELPKAFSVRDDHEFYPIQHLLARLNPKLMVNPVATGRHSDGGCTVLWGIVYLEGHAPSEAELTAALRQAGFDFDHWHSIQPADVWAGSTVGPA
jgi:hypothetical protein